MSKKEKEESINEIRVLSKLRYLTNNKLIYLIYLLTFSTLLKCYLN